MRGKMSDDLFPLYRYRTVNKHLIDAIVNQRLYFSLPSSLNDPFDCCVKLETVFERAVASTTGRRSVLLSMYLNNKKFFSNWRSTIDSWAVCCFSQTINETLLWAHYADGHKGVCLEYTFAGTDFAQGGNGNFKVGMMDNVEYKPQRLTELLLSTPLDELDISNGPENEKFKVELVRRYIFTKSTEWQYEKESRFMRGQSGLYKPDIDRPLITKICFGLRTPPEDIALITKLASNYSTGTRFTQMVKDGAEFEFREEELRKRFTTFLPRRIL
jgi:hypothetical protein